MKIRFLTFLLIATYPIASIAAPPPTPVRTIKDLRGLPLDALRRKISRPLYRSLEVSPVEAWVVARASIYNAQTASAKIVHSEANGAYDKMALELANGYSVSGTDTTESRLPNDSLTIHLLIFKIKDGEMAICFAHTDDARYLGYQQIGEAWIGVLKNGTWTRVNKQVSK